MIDRKHIGKTRPPHTVDVEKGRLNFFAKAIGETNPIYTDEEAARRAGYSSLPAPPTFTFCLEQDLPNAFEFLDSIGVDIRKVLHGEQSFTYHGPICAGDQITLETRIADIYDKKDGALDFIVLDTTCRKQGDIVVAEQRTVLVVRNC
ncbi:MAG: MaoC family dehydratase N-terminal domain-containing protein [Candidatus Acidiferrales bacterium]